MRSEQRVTDKEGGGVTAEAATAAAAAKSSLNKIGDGRSPRRRWPAQFDTCNEEERQNYGNFTATGG